MHTKYILLDNIYLILPLIRSSESTDQLQAALKNILNLTFIYNSSTGKELHIDSVNVSALFDDRALLKDLLISVISVLMAYEEDSASQE